MKRNISIVIMVSLFVFCALSATSYAGHPKPQLGAFLGELDDELREEMGYHGKGVLIHGIVKGSGAEKSGLAKGDIILEFNQEKVSSVQDLVNAVKQTTPGDKIQIKFFRKGETKIIPIEITEKKNWIEFAPPQKWVHFKSDRPYLGLRMQELNSQLAEYFKTRSGILITEVTKDGPANEADLRAGDVITAWQDKEIKDLREFYRQLDHSKGGDKIEFEVVRHGEKLKKEIVLGEPKYHETYGFHINRDDTGDLIFRMGSKEPPAHLNIPVPDIGLDLQDLKDDLKSLKDGMGSYREEMNKLMDEIRKLKEEIGSLKEEKI